MLLVGLFLGRRGRGGRRCGRRRRLGRVDPARFNPPVQAVGSLRINAGFMLDQTAKRGLDMTGRTAEAIVKIEMAERCVDIVAPDQTDRAPAEPDAFGIARGAANHPLDD